MTKTGKTKRVLLWMITSICGALGFVLFMWTPKTGKGILAYVALLAVLVVIAIALAPPRSGYWPDRHDDR
jgi:hypothetical protein